MTDMQMVKALVNAMSEEEIETLAEYLQQRPIQKSEASSPKAGIIFGLSAGRVTMRDDFDAPLDDVFGLDE